MTHALAIVILPPGNNDWDVIGEDLERILLPWREEYMDELGKWQYRKEGWWDWWQIGGRWTGVISGYDPDKDPENFDFDRGEVKWPTQWVLHNGDVCYPADVLVKIMETLQHEDENRRGLGMIFLAGEELLQREIYHFDKEYPDCFERVEDFDQRAIKILQTVHPESRCVVVDYHS